MQTDPSTGTYTVGVQRPFIARHYLVGGDWGEENLPHAHAYLVEVRLTGSKLDRHGYLVDIDQIVDRLAALIDRFKNQLLNELPEFAVINPSLEHFSRILCDDLCAKTRVPGLASISVKLWENDTAWAEYRRKF
jgi:6-pyruvoyltetrahydropterin/6-carboxytetrahydropterin synthase